MRMQQEQQNKGAFAEMFTSEKSDEKKRSRSR